MILLVNVSVDLGEGQLKFIRKLLDEGNYRSRSEAVRDFVRRAEFEWEWRKAIKESTNKIVDIENERSAVSRQLLKRFA